jgi:2-(1,2-epoxy-1,2-dihydrophenyl)acetyl-CoA isomerase
MTYENILFDQEDGIVTITLNRPDKLNAYTTEMGDEVTHAFRAVQRDADVRVIILTGAGKAFCAGADLEHLKAHEAGKNVSKGPRLGEEDFLRKLPLEMRDSKKPIIAAINGHAVGVGMTMVMPCDIRIVANEAKLGFIFGKLGILPGLGSSHLLPTLVGMAKAQELVLTAKKILGPEAAEIGLANKSVPSVEVLAEARAMAAEIAAIDPHVLEYAKRALHFGAAHSMAESMKNEQRQSAELKAVRDRAKAES